MPLLLLYDASLPERVTDTFVPPLRIRRRLVLNGPGKFNETVVIL